jgi:heat shock protein HslJ
MRRGILAVVFASAVLLVGCSNPDSLTGRTWYLTSVTGRVPIFQWDLKLRDLNNYTITFNADGSYAALADCNQTGGTYTTTAPRGISIVPGLSTMAFCGPESHGNLFVGMLAAAKNYTVRLNDLTLETADGGSLKFTALRPAASGSPATSGSPTSATASPTTRPTSTPSAAATPTATTKPTATPTAKPSAGSSATPKPTTGASATPKPTAAPTTGPTPTPTAAPSEGLLGKEWQLTAITIADPPFQGAIDEAQQPSYTITFNQDATFAAKADCNTLAGGYATPDPKATTGTLTITPGPSTVVACSDGSLSVLYMDSLGRAASYAIADNLLTITLLDGGTLQYK